MILEGEVLKALGFLVSLEWRAEVASRFVNGRWARECAHYYKLMHGNEKLLVRNLCRKAFNKELCFARAEDTIIVPSKGC